MRALVTGATGLLGGYVVQCLAAAGWEVRGLVREPGGNGAVKAMGGQPVYGQLGDPASLCAAARGCDAIVHTAARIGSGSGWEPFRQGNVDGTENVIAAAEAAGSRLVHVSSTAVFGRHRYHALPTDEATPLPELPAADAYGRSKQEAERRVRAAHDARRIWATVLRPPVMYGRGDRQFAPRVGPVLARGVFPLVNGGLSTLALVHAHAVAEGAVRASTTDVAGGRVYHLTDDFEVTAADLVRYASLGLARRIRTPRVSGGAARLALRALAAALSLGGRRDLAHHTEGLLDTLTRNNPFTSDRARRELGWNPTVRPADGLPEAFRWWSEHGGG